MALALMRNYDPFQAPTHFRLVDLMKKFDKTFGATKKARAGGYGKVEGDRTIQDIEKRRPVGTRQAIAVRAHADARQKILVLLRRPEADRRGVRPGLDVHEPGCLEPPGRRLGLREEPGVDPADEVGDESTGRRKRRRAPEQPCEVPSRNLDAIAMSDIIQAVQGNQRLATESAEDKIILDAVTTSETMFIQCAGNKNVRAILDELEKLGDI